jgi:hypothetical protein
MPSRRSDRLYETLSSAARGPSYGRRTESEEERYMAASPRAL